MRIKAVISRRIAPCPRSTYWLIDWSTGWFLGRCQSLAWTPAHAVVSPCNDTGATSYASTDNRPPSTARAGPYGSFCEAPNGRRDGLFCENRFPRGLRMAGIPRCRFAKGAVAPPLIHPWVHAFAGMTMGICVGAPFVLRTFPPRVGETWPHTTLGFLLSQE